MVESPSNVCKIIGEYLAVWYHNATGNSLTIYYLYNFQTKYLNYAIETCDSSLAIP